MKTRRILSFMLALALCLGLALPASAADRSLWPDYYTLELEADYVKVDQDLDMYFCTERTATLYQTDSYYAITGGATFTLTNIKDGAGYVYAIYQPYTMQTESFKLWLDDENFDANEASQNLEAMVEMKGSYVCRPEEGRVMLNSYVLNSNGGWTWTVDGNVNPISEGIDYPESYVDSWSGLLLYSGESATFTLPDDGTDTIYLLYIVYNNPETGNYVWQSSEFKYENAAAAADTVAGFSDVHESDYYAEAVEWAKENGVTSGTSAATFSPAAAVTRAEAMTFLWRAAGAPEPSTTVSPFTDVTDSSAYYYKAVLWAAEQGITNGVSSTTFGLNNTLSYDQILTFLCRAAGESANGSDWSAAAVNWAKENGLTNGLDFTAKGSCPRADVVYCLWKQLES